MSSILNIGQSALAAAQAGLATTGHNVANASTPGYNRQTVVQAALAGQNQGFGYIGRGTEIASVTRVYNEFLGNQVVSAQSAKSRLDSYYTQVKRIDSLVADPQTGVSPSLQNFFKSVQNISGSPNGAEARQSLLSSASTLVSNIRALDNQLSEINAGVNSEIAASITTLNAYAKQLAQLNDAIEKAQGSLGSKPANDLLDRRDHLISEIAKEVNVSVVKQGNSYNLFIGSGQPLVMGTQTYTLTPLPHPADPQRLQVGYALNGGPQALPDNSISGGRLGGLLEFRSRTLDATKNELGRMTAALAMTFNEQHSLGKKPDGSLGGNFFKIELSSKVQGQPSGELLVTLDDSSRLTASDYSIRYYGSKYHVTRLSDGKTFGPEPSLEDLDVDGLVLSLGTDADGDPLPAPPAGATFLIRPAASVLAGFDLAVRDRADIAVAAPMVTSMPLSNAGTGKISAGMALPGFELPVPSLTLAFNADPAPNGSLTGFPPGAEVTVVINGVEQVPGFPAEDPVPYTAGATYRFNGMEFTFSGTPVAGDEFGIAENTNIAGDGRNAVLLGALQAKDTIEGGLSYQGAYAQMVSMIGNMTREVEVTNAGATKLYKQASEAQQSMSGVNLDEEASNLIRYQQAYQAAGKVMQTASVLFDTLLSIGR